MAGHRSASVHDVGSIGGTRGFAIFVVILHAQTFRPRGAAQIKKCCHNCKNQQKAQAHALILANARESVPSSFAIKVVTLSPRPFVVFNLQVLNNYHSQV